LALAIIAAPPSLGIPLKLLLVFLFVPIACVLREAQRCDTRRGIQRSTIAASDTTRGSPGRSFHRHKSARSTPLIAHLGRNLEVPLSVKYIID
jgi:hypothetical protein